MRTCRLSIHGRVQGVGFRDSMRREALRLGVDGWVRNRIDGSVEATTRGEDRAIETLIDWSRRGPPAARVTRVDVEELASDAFDAVAGFEFRATC